jgi:2EXR family
MSSPSTEREEALDLRFTNAMNLNAPKHKYPMRTRPQICYQDMESSAGENSDNDGFLVIRQHPRKKVKQLPKKKVFPLFSLPRELRDMIYEHTLVDPKGVLFKSTNSLYRRVPYRVRKRNDINQSEIYWWRYRVKLSNERPERLGPTLLRTCKAIYEEALPILYGQPITFIDTKAMHNFLYIVGPSNVALLKEVALEELAYSGANRTIARPAFCLLAPATGLRKLRFESRVGYSHERGSLDTHCSRLAKKIFATAFEAIETWVQDSMQRSSQQRRDVAGVFDLQRQNFGSQFPFEMSEVRETFSKVFTKMIQRSIDRRYKIGPSGISSY